ncbi:MAG: Re/Si-specific NAD(P)(+) transhydrogenase subunit alpha [Bdellovibrionaceae bacterium]|nr:Re/Si-specific NAD(P)(+) transhydrogenase subunit alpha [Bdellovibrionales bacterium]MCB9084329.1 Re/Si-specific NAD(P)(+) transhydrogenase subunit alpha [Pseudobdellovibrionaceae bacterium]
MTPLKIGVPLETKEGECRVALTPDTAKKLQKMGFTLQIEAGAGAKADFTDEAYRKVGVTVVDDCKTLWATSDIVMKINPPQQHSQLGTHEIDLLKPEGHLISMIWPAQNKDLVDRLAAKRATVISMDCIPRISRAQKMDVLSSMANIAGYRAVLEAANLFGRFFTGQITAAGKVPPAKVMVIGAGVAGLAAIGAARGLGAIVRAFDTRPEVKDQVKSMGAEFLELDFEEEGAGTGGYAKVMSPEFIKAEMELFAQQAREVDIIITTALIPGKPAPRLITAETAGLMKEGSVIVDLAAEQGGNCELTEKDKVVRKGGVSIVGYSNLPSRLPSTASQLYGTNMTHLLSDMTKGGEYKIDLEDEVVRGALIVHNGEVTWPPPKPAGPPPQAKPAPAKAPPPPPVEKPKGKVSGLDFALIGLAIALFVIGRGAPNDFLGHFSVFVLACVVGWQVVWNVTPALHTPLMSVTNAISGIIIIGAIVQLKADVTGLAAILSLIAVVISSINIAGGFLVTKRMLKMFQK